MKENLEANNVYEDEQKYIEESLKEFAQIVYEYNMTMEKNVKSKGQIIK